MDITKTKIFNLHQDTKEYPRKRKIQFIAQIFEKPLIVLAFGWFLFFPTSVGSDFLNARDVNGEIRAGLWFGGTLLLLIPYIAACWYSVVATNLRKEIESDLRDLAKLIDEKQETLYSQSTELTSSHARLALHHLMKRTLRYQRAPSLLNVYNQVDHEVEDFLRESLKEKAKSLNEAVSENFDTLQKFGFVHKQEYGSLFEKAKAEL